MAAMMRSAKERTMKKAAAITCLFLDIGGVLLTDGWIIMPANGRRSTSGWI